MMSDFIPPLISSTPPPMPDFDDDEEDDDVEFGMGISSGIGEDLDFSVPVDCDDEKKGKTIEIDNTRLEINGITNNWKCEEQDSTSQDSGLCMASQSSEGMSPLPQSDDDEKCNQDNDNSTVNMKHSSTVMFNPDDMTSSKSNCTIAYNNDIAQEHDKTDKVLPADTGQNDPSNMSENINSQIVNGETDDKTNFNNESDSDSEFVWGSNTNNEDLFQNLSFQNNGNNDSGKVITNIPNDIENEEIDNTLCDNSTDSFHKTVLGISDENSISKDSIDVVSSSSMATDERAVVNEILSNSDNNLCDNLNTSEPCHDENDDYDDDFGNFASVTIPDSDSVFHNSSVNDFTPGEPKIVESFEDDLFNNRLNDESSIKNYECDLKCKLKSNVNSVVNECEVSEANDNSCKINNEHDNLNLKRSCEDDSLHLDSINIVVNNDEDDDEFDDFSDFTQSSDLPATSFQTPEVINRSDPATRKVVSTEENLEEIFPKPENDVYSGMQPNNLEAGPVWKHLCPLENSPALTFQWSNSQAHNKLLSALSIDSRNILFGPHWNANIPRFAANLGSNPLQPVKAAETQSGTSPSPIPPINEEAAVVPDAHFDWVGSGLTNPLDCVTDKTNIEFKQSNGSCKPPNTVDNLNILSDEAESIISLLPDLNFMRKTYIEILISKE